MEHTFLYRASLFDEGKPLHVFLKEHHYSGKLISRLRRTPDGLQIAGKTVYTNHIMEAGEVLQVRVMEERDSSHILPVPMPLNILYEDTDLMVLNKPSNLPVHPSIGNYDNTLANGLVHYFACSGQPFTFRIINRLDRDTTGLVIIAKHSLSACILYDMAAKRMLHRTYLAVVTGHLSGSGTICAPIARTSDSVISRCVDFARGEQAVTHYEALEYQNGYTLVQTGTPFLWTGISPSNDRTKPVFPGTVAFGHDIHFPVLVHKKQSLPEAGFPCILDLSVYKVEREMTGVGDHRFTNACCLFS